MKRKDISIGLKVRVVTNAWIGDEKVSVVTRFDDRPKLVWVKDPAILFGETRVKTSDCKPYDGEMPMGTVIGRKDSIRL